MWNSNDCKGMQKIIFTSTVEGRQCVTYKQRNTFHGKGIHCWLPVQQENYWDLGQVSDSVHLLLSWEDYPQTSWIVMLLVLNLHWLCLGKRVSLSRSTSLPMIREAFWLKNYKALSGLIASLDSCNSLHMIIFRDWLSSIIKRLFWQTVISVNPELKSHIIGQLLD